MDGRSDEPRISASERDPARRDQPGTQGRPLVVEYRCSTLLRDNDLGQPVGSHGGRRHAGIDGWLNSDFLYLNETAPRWERLRTRSSTHGVNNSRHPARLDLCLEPRRSAVLISALAMHGGRLGPFRAAGTPRSLDISRQFTAHLFTPWIPRSTRCNISCSRSNRFWLCELRVSRHF